MRSVTLRSDAHGPVIFPEAAAPAGRVPGLPTAAISLPQESEAHSVLRCVSRPHVFSICPHPPGPARHQMELRTSETFLPIAEKEHVNTTLCRMARTFWALQYLTLVHSQLSPHFYPSASAQPDTGLLPTSLRPA